MNFKYHAVSLLGLLILSSLSLFAQDTNTGTRELSLSLQEALERASEDGYELLIARQEEEAARAGLSQTNSLFLPQLSIEERAVKTNDPIGVFGIKLRQGIIQQSDFNPAELNEPDATHNFTTSFEVRQPVFNPEGIFQRAAAKYRLKSVKEQLQATSQYTHLKVKEVYYKLGILDEQIQVIKKHLQTSESFGQQASDYFDEGIIPKSEYLKTQISVLDAEKELLKVQNQRDMTNDQLLVLLGIQDDVKVKVLSRPQEEGAATEVSALSVIGMNSELMAMKNQVEASGAMLKAAKSGFIPSLNLFGAYELHDADLFGNQADNYMIGASLKWDLFKGFKQVGLMNQRKAELRANELQFEQQKLNHKVNVKEARRSVELALKNIELSKLAIQQSEEEVRFRKDRYEQGMEKTSDLLLAESKNLENQLYRLQALYQYEMAMARLEYLLEKEL